MRHKKTQGTPVLKKFFEMDQNFIYPNSIDISTIPLAISFSIYSSREIQELSVVEIFCPIFFDKKGVSIFGGLCDPKMGTCVKKKNCMTCHENYMSCSGHYGHINFVIPLINPFLKNLFLKITKATCWYCHFFKYSNWKTKLFFLKFLLIETETKFKIKFLKNFLFLKKIYIFKKIHIFSKKKPKILRLIKNVTNVIKKNYNYNSFPEIKIFKKKKKNKFWSFYLNIFLKFCNQQKFCQRCKKLKIINKKFIFFIERII